MKTYTPEEKKQYMASLREKYSQTKKQLTEEKKAEIEKFIRENALRISPMSFFFVSLQMRSLGLDGIPYRDCKTFKGWKDEGHSVKKGEKSRISGIVWIHPQHKNTDGEIEENMDYLFPKEYHLFHRTQVKQQ